MADMNSWEPTPELRWLKCQRVDYAGEFPVSYIATVLQQKWVEIGPHAVVDPPGPAGYAPARIIEDHPTGKSEWRDVPRVAEDAA